MADKPLWELFQNEIQAQTRQLNDGILQLEQHSFFDDNLLQEMTRYAHSIKGAARVVALTSIVQLAHALEDVFEAARNKKITLDGGDTDLFFQIVDLLAQIPRIPQEEISSWLESQKALVDPLIKKLCDHKDSPEKHLEKIVEKAIGYPKQTEEHAILRVNADKLTRMMGLAGEALIESRHLSDFTQRCLQVLPKEAPESRVILSECMAQFELMISQQLGLTDRLYAEVVDSRMRPFADGTEALPRLVRDIAKQTQKKASLEIVGESTLVDREILDKLETALIQLLRNSVGHGIETPEERMSAGKNPEGKIKLNAQQSAGMLLISLSDDGRGINVEEVQKKIVEKKLASPEKAAGLSATELLDFLFLPGFTMSDQVTEISGRGVGLDIVRKMIDEVSGSIQIESIPGKGVTIYLQLPLTLSLMRALLVEIAGESYAFPLSRIDRVLSSKETPSESLTVISAAHLLGFEESKLSEAILVLKDHANGSYALAVDCFIGEKELVVQKLDKALGKIPGVLAGSIREDGAPVIILAVDEMIELYKQETRIP